MNTKSNREITLSRRKVYDLIQRICHFGIAFFTLILLLSAYAADFFYEDGLMRKSLWISHVLAGFSLTAVLAIRIVWGFVGPYHARFSSMWKYQEWKQFFLKKKKNTSWTWGHHPTASLAYLLFYLLILLICLTGIILAAIEHNLGPLAQSLYDQLKYQNEVQEVHEALSIFVILFIVSHLGALLFHELKENVPNIQSMFSGYQYKEFNEAKKNGDKDNEETN